ncbi:FMN adenylyltransferase (EC 2.7.7.2) / Riboflavin kinase (EC 2.7.1.26) [Oscillospiraceae bacterium]|nr:FMN adenylyltransferase (EC 2.7.7.2) / Riboflavin kinase (EC 2.7.1.26) [Oscillospiraceae bacterium]
MNERRVIALGFFDGVHIGHGALLKKTCERAAELGAIPAAMSFDTHPDTLVFGTPTELLNTMDERKQLMQSLYGIEDVIFCHFDKAMMNMDWEAFVEDYLIRELHACHLVCGHDYHFGARGFGNAERLTEKCRALGLGCDVIGEVKLDGVTVSSTYLRRLLKEGRMEEAVRFLGHGHIISGIVQHGDSRGHTLGLPTANLALDASLLVPAFGVYGGWADAGELGRFPAAVNLGVHPTVHELPHPVAEASLLGFDGDLYGRFLRLELLFQVRPERQFSSLQELTAQIARDQQTVLHRLTGV